MLLTIPRGYGKSWQQSQYLWWLDNSNKILDTLPIPKEPKEKQLKYEFHLSSYEQQFDVERVAEDISYNNPIAIIDIDRETGGKDLIVLLSNDLLDKAHICGIPEIIRDVIYGDSSYSMIIGIVKNDIQPMIEWCTKVKLTPWPKAHRNKATINVSFPKV